MQILLSFCKSTLGLMYDALEIVGEVAMNYISFVVDPYHELNQTL